LTDWLGSVIVVPVSVYVRGAEREAVMHQGRVYGDSAFSVIQQFMEVEQMTLAAAHAVPRTILVQHKHLARIEPTLSHAHSPNG